MARLRAVVGCLVALAVVAGGFGEAAAAPRPGGDTIQTISIGASEYCSDSEERAFLTLINNYRRQHGVAPVNLSRTLGAAAEHHSVDMASRNYFSHTLPGGVTWSQNMTNHGYTANTYRGENIAAGNSSAQATFNQWVNSSNHRANMLSANFNAIGIGRAYNSGATYKWYWTTTFGGYADEAAPNCSTTAPAPTPAPSSGTAYTIVRSGRTSGSNSSLYAYDNQPGTAWITNYSSRPRSSAYVYFDLGAAKPLGAIQWTWQQTGYADRVLVQVSTDRSTWTTVAAVGNAPAGAWQRLETPGTTARYVRFYFQNPNKDRQLGSLAEVKLTA